MHDVVPYLRVSLVRVPLAGRELEARGGGGAGQRGARRDVMHAHARLAHHAHARTVRRVPFGAADLFFRFLSMNKKNSLLKENMFIWPRRQTTHYTGETKK